MHEHLIQRVLLVVSMVGLPCYVSPHVAQAQFTQNRETVKIGVSEYPPEIRRSYNVFSVKCGECHTLDKTLKPSLPSAQWAAIVRKMQAMASSHITDADVQQILNFINYDEANRKAQLKSEAASGAADSIAAGRALFSTQGCDACHSIAGKGGDIGPTLNGVGGKLSRDQLTDVVKNGKPNTAMPALPPGTDQQVRNLVDFLASLK